MKNYFFILFILNFISAAKLTDVPITLHQPNGDVINCFTSGDEYYHYLHDENAYTIIESKTNGYYYYADIVYGNVVPSIYLAGNINPSMVGLQRKILISPEEYRNRRDRYYVEDDLRVVRSIYENFNGNPPELQEIILWLDLNPGLIKKNNRPSMIDETNTVNFKLVID